METKAEFIKSIKDEMKELFGVILTDEQVKEHIEKENLEYFDTLERGDYIHYIGKTITGMDYPCNADSDEYSREFWTKLRDNHKEKGYQWEEWLTS